MAYTDIAYCDTVNTSTAWVAADDPTKQLAIDMGELWIDKTYTCVISDPVQDNLQRANALLADKHVNGDLYEVQEGEIKSKSVTADTVSSSKEYLQGSGTVDPFAEVNLLLGSVCSINSGSFFITVRV